MLNWIRPLRSWIFQSFLVFAQVRTRHTICARNRKRRELRTYVQSRDLLCRSRDLLIFQALSHGAIHFPRNVSFENNFYRGFCLKILLEEFPPVRKWNLGLTPGTKRSISHHVKGHKILWQKTMSEMLYIYVGGCAIGKIWLVLVLIPDGVSPTLSPCMVWRCVVYGPGANWAGWGARVSGVEQGVQHLSLAPHPPLDAVSLWPLSP